MTRNYMTIVEHMWCYAAFALVMNGNRTKFATELVSIMHSEFPKFTKLIYRGNLAQALSRNNRLFAKERPYAESGQVYRLDLDFYEVLSEKISVETKPLLAELEGAADLQAIIYGIKLLYQRQVNSHTNTPTLVSVFRQAGELFDER